jgi:hydroxylamine reductase (hybrid-cluster protein)
MSQEKMFCYQCEQTVKGQGCTIVGVCGKTPDVATLQDLLVYVLRGLSQLSIEARKVGVETEEVTYVHLRSFVRYTDKRELRPR